MKTVGLELQPCCGNRTGIGIYAYEIARRLFNSDELQFRGRVFDFLKCNSALLDEIPFPVDCCPLLKYGVYRRIWKYVPIRYDKFFPVTDLSIFFNYIVPPKVEGKIITTIHDLAYIRFPETLDRKNLVRIEKDISRSIECSQKIITVSEFSKQEIMECLHVMGEDIVVIPSAPSIGQDILCPENVMLKYRIHPPFILYVGTIEPRKNILRLILAFERLKKEHGIPHSLVLAGGNGWNNKDIYRRAYSSAYSEDIIFTGYVQENEKYALYKAADVFVFPSVYEGFGLPPLEAMHFGCPVVTTKVASLPEVVGDAAELIDYNDENKIAQSIWKVLSDHDYQNRLIQKGYQQIRRYSWDQTAKKVEKICQEVLKK